MAIADEQESYIPIEFDDTEPAYFDFVIRDGLRQRNRGSLDIIFSMLKAASKGALKTHILYRSNLSSVQVQLYLEFLLKRGLIEKEMKGSLSREVYVTTTKGRRYIEAFNALCKILIY